MRTPADTERASLELARAGFELSQARARLRAAVRHAAEAGLSQRAIASALGTNQVAIHRMLKPAPTVDLPPPVRYERPDARFHYELHREIARRVLVDGFDVDRARTELTRISASTAGARRWLDEWARVLELPDRAMVDAFLRAGPEGDDLRQVSPLRGIVSDDERTAALNRAYET